MALKKSLQKFAIVYQITNLVTGDTYIGVTNRPEKRKQEHFREAVRGNHHALYAAIREYGKSMFRMRVVAGPVSPKAALSHESRLIALWRPAYNNRIPSLPAEMVCAVHSQSHIDAMKIQEALSARHALRVTSSSKSALAMGRAKAVQNRKKKIICLSTGEVFPSGRDAAKRYNLSPATICNVVSGKAATANGLLFSFYTGKEKKLPNSELAIKAIRKKQRERAISRYPVKKVISSDGRDFNSVAIAAQAYGVQTWVIRDLIYNRRKSSLGGVRFSYYLQEAS